MIRQVSSLIFENLNSRLRLTERVWCMIKTLVRVAIVVAVVVVCLCLPGCVKTTRIVTNQEGKVTEEVTSWEPIVVNTYPTPIAYAPPVVYDYAPPVVYRTYYSSPIVYRRSYVVSRPVYYGGRTVYIGGGHHLYRRH